MFIIEISIIVLIAFLSVLSIATAISWDDIQEDDYFYILCLLLLILILSSSIYLGVFE